MGLLRGCVLACVLSLASCGEPAPRVRSDAGTDATVDGSTMVSATIQGELISANGYPGQLYTLFRAGLGSSSVLSRMKLFARFCADAACATPISLVPLQVDEDPDANGRYLLSTASTSGVGFTKAFIISQAPLGSSFMQIIGDTQMSEEGGLGTCSTTANCPGDFDVVSMSGFQIGQNNDGKLEQPVPYAIPVTVSGAGATVMLDSTVYLGHLHFERGPLATPAPTDNGTLVAAVSNASDSYRNAIALIDLDDASGHPGAVTPASYTLQKGAADFAGDVCGLVRGGDYVYAIGIDNTGANVFKLSASTGLQVSNTPQTIPASDVNDANTFPWPCRGVYGSMGGKEHLYLVNFKGGGSLNTSSPYPFYDVNLTDDVTGTPVSNTDLALRAVAIDGESHLFAVDMSWSQASINSGMQFDRLYSLMRDLNGNVVSMSTAKQTLYKSDEQCGGNFKLPSGLAVVTLDGTPRLLMGHNDGVAVYDVGNRDEVANLPLTSFGQVFVDFAASLDGTRMYAMPQCKSAAPDRFELPYGAGVENADTNLVAILDTTGSDLAVASTTLDIDGDGTADNGIDLDYYFLKRYIRGYGTTLPIPPVVFTAPQLAVGASMLFVRGSGIQGNGTPSQLSTSGLGQVQDIGFFSLTTGRGVVFGDYTPWVDGLSAEMGTGGGIWGYDLQAGRSASVGALLYLPAAP